MSAIHKEHLQAGYIFGDPANAEYIYMPAGEVSASEPLCVLERGDRREDVPLEEAADLIDRLSLRPCRHPLLGEKAF